MKVIKLQNSGDISHCFQKSSKLWTEIRSKKLEPIFQETKITSPCLIFLLLSKRRIVKDSLTLKNKLQNLAAQQTDVLESLSSTVRKRVEALREIQVIFFGLEWFSSPFCWFCLIDILIWVNFACAVYVFTCIGALSLWFFCLLFLHWLWNFYELAC